MLMRCMVHTGRKNNSSHSYCTCSLSYKRVCGVKWGGVNALCRAGVEAASTSGEVVSKWRMKDRMKTMSVALILCLNVGVDPPDVLKIPPCARMQCWINPLSMAPQKALDAIGKALQAQYERWQPRAKYKLQLDPTVEDVKKLCISCRRNAKNERVLLHYNGHGGDVHVSTCHSFIRRRCPRVTRVFAARLNERFTGRIHHAHAVHHTVRETYRW